MTINDLIAIWGSKARLARAIGEGESTVRAWFTRGSIPFRADEKIISAAKSRGETVTPIDLHEIRRSMTKPAELQQCGGKAAVSEAMGLSDVEVCK